MISGLLGFHSSPGGRTIVARGFEPLEARAHLSLFRRPEGGRGALKNFVLVKIDSVKAKQCEKLRFEILSLVMLLLSRNVGLAIGYDGFADRESAVAFLPGEMTVLREHLVSPF